MEEQVKEVHIKTNPDVVITDEVPIREDRTSKKYPIYSDEAGTIAYSCRVINGKLI